MPFAFHLPRLRIELDWFAKIFTSWPFLITCITWDWSFAAFTSYHRLALSLFCFCIPAKNLLCHLTPIVILGSEIGRLNSNHLLSGENKHIFRCTKIELRFQIRWDLFIPLLSGWVGPSKIYKLFGILQWRRWCDGMDVCCRFVQRFIDSDGYPFVSGCLEFIHSFLRLGYNFMQFAQIKL